MGEVDRQLHAEGTKVMRAVIEASGIECRARHDIARLRGELLDLISDLPPDSPDQQTVRDIRDILAEVTDGRQVSGNTCIIEIAEALKALRSRDKDV